MVYSAKSFGTKSKFASLPWQRKAALVCLFVVLGYAVADPEFLSDSAVTVSDSASDGERVEEFLSDFETVLPAHEVPRDGPEVIAQMEVASAQSPRSLVVKSVSYPSPDIVDGSGFENEPQSSSSSVGASPLMIPRQTRTVAEERENRPPSLKKPSIRFTGTIYPSSQ